MIDQEISMKYSIYPFLITQKHIHHDFTRKNPAFKISKSQDEKPLFWGPLRSPHNEVQLRCIRLDHRRLPRAQMLRIGMGEPAEHGLN